MRQRLPWISRISVAGCGSAAIAWRGVEVIPAFFPSSRLYLCAKCGNEIPIAFHDGATNRTMNAQTRTSYGLFWDQTHLRWDFAPLAVIMQRGRLP